MAKLSEAEIRSAIDRLMQETEHAQRAALQSGESFINFLEKAGLLVIAQKIGEALATAWDWVVDTLADIFDVLFG